MSNFAFLAAEFPAVHEAAGEAACRKRDTSTRWSIWLTCRSGIMSNDRRL
jgi:hypothetical protein